MEVFVRERDIARHAAVTEADSGGGSENEQFVWVLWKILKGDGGDVCDLLFRLRAPLMGFLQLGPYTPIQLVNSPLPFRIRAAQLTVDESIGAEDESFREQYAPLPLLLAS